MLSRKIDFSARYLAREDFQDISKVVTFNTNSGTSGIDRYVIAAKGKINNKPALIGVVVKSYPRYKSNSKFYLHEAEIIETDSPIMTAPQLSVDTVSESVPKEIQTRNEFVETKEPKAIQIDADPDNILPIPKKVVKQNQF